MYTSTALPHVAALAPYPPGRPIASVVREFGLEPEHVIKLASNENPLGSSPAVAEALYRYATEAHSYPDFDCFELRQALALKTGFPVTHLLPSAGSSELIVLVARAYLDAQRKAVVSQHTFISHISAVRSVGAMPVLVPEVGFAPDLDAMLAAIDERTSVVYLASPNNPTGSMLSAADIAAFAASLPEHTLFVLDEAYRDFVAPEQRPDITHLLTLRRNMLVLRTFSKIYGLAGLRVGYAISNPEIIETLRRLQPPFTVSGIASAAAVAALGDDAFAERSYTLNRLERERLAHALQARGLRVLPSNGNFVLVRVGCGSEIVQRLMQRGVIVRAVDNHGLPEWIRVSVGLPDQNDRFLAELSVVMA
jgi:histidinol-phosphate aminotransferase